MFYTNFLSQDTYLQHFYMFHIEILLLGFSNSFHLFLLNLTKVFLLNLLVLYNQYMNYTMKRDYFNQLMNTINHLANFKAFQPLYQANV